MWIIASKNQQFTAYLYVSNDNTIQIEGNLN